MSSLSSLAVACAEGRLDLPLFRFGAGKQRALIVAGVHGWEHSSISIAYALAEWLAEHTPRGTVDILPVANPPGFAAERRENPADGQNLGQSFTLPEAGSDAAGTAGQTAAIALRILQELQGCSHLLDLHAAGEARYLPHALFLREQDAEPAAASGLPFVMLRSRTREGSRTGMLCQAALGRRIEALALELGGGIVTFTRDIELGMRSVLSLLSLWGYLSESHRLAPTPPERIYRRDERRFIRAREDGAFYTSLEPGAELEQGQRLGTWISLESYQAVPVLADEPGLIIYLRTRCRCRQGDTLAMLLPQRPGGLNSGNPAGRPAEHPAEIKEENSWHK